MGDAARAVDFVSEPELFLNGSQITNHHARCERLPASAAAGLLLLLSYVFVEAYAELSRSLEDVKQLAEWKPKQREDYSDGVQYGEEIVGVTLHPGIAG